MEISKYISYEQNKSEGEQSDHRLLYEAERMMGRSMVSALIGWKNKIGESRARYFVFMVRRCYILFLLLERISGVSLNDREDRINVTDSGMLLQCKELFDYYEKYGGRFPKIEIIDDILIHGRNINNLLRVMEERLLEICEQRCNQYCSENEMRRRKEDVRNAFVESVTIRIFYCSQESLLLSPRFLFCLDSFKYVKLPKLRQLSNQLSSLVLYADIANATYIISEKIKASQMAHILEKSKAEAGGIFDYGAVTSVYQNNIQHLLIKYFRGKDQNIAGIGIVRFTYSVQTDSYRAIPLVILPQLSDRETQQMIELISENYRSAKLRNWMETLYAVKGMRMSNEFITLVLSNALLLHFNEEFGIERDQKDFTNEILKLARNYYLESLSSSEKRLRMFLQQSILRCGDLEKIIRDVTGNGEGLIKEKKKNKEDERELTGKEKAELRQYLEDYIYDLGWNDEKKAVECGKNVVFDSRKTFIRENIDSYDLLKVFMQGMDCKQRNYILAVFFQMMDAGILSFSSFSSQGDSVKGVRQYTKAGEQALFLEPIKMYLYIPMLSEIEKTAEQKKIDFKEELREFFDSGKSEIDLAEQNNIWEFVEKIGAIEQKMIDWDGNYYRKLDFLEDNQEIHDIRQYFERQIFYMKRYQEFAS